MSGLFQFRVITVGMLLEERLAGQFFIVGTDGITADLKSRASRRHGNTTNQMVIEDIAIRHAMLRVIRFLGVFEQDARLQPGALFLADPGEFEFLALSDHYF